MTNYDLFRLLYDYLEEREFNNIQQNLMQDTAYLKCMEEEQELFQQYMDLDLSLEQRTVIDEWVDTIQNRNGAYSMVVFRMAMQLCYSLITQLKVD